MLELELEDDSGSSMRSLWRDSMSCSITPMNSLFVGVWTMRSAMRWQAVAMALRRLYGNTVGAPRTWRSRERWLFPKGRAMSLLLEGARQRWFFLDYWGPRETPSWRPSRLWSRAVEGRDQMAVFARTNSPPTVMMKSRLLKRTCAPGTLQTSWLAIHGLVWNAQRPLPDAPTVGVSNKHCRVNL